MRADDYLFPNDLCVTHAPIQRVLITGSCMSTAYHAHLNHKGIENEYIASNGFAEPRAPSRPIEDFDFEVVQLALREILTDRVIAFHRFSNDDYRRAIIEDAENILRQRLSAYLRRSRENGMLTFVCNFIVPQLPVAASLRGAGTEHDLTALVRHLNGLIAEIVGEHANAYVSDIDAIAGSMGKKAVHDDMVHFYSHSSSWGSRVQVFDTAAEFNAPHGGRLEAVPAADDLYGLAEDEFLDAVWRQWVSLYRTIHQIDQVKLVIFDLDDTLWRGQIAEHYGEGGWPVSHGWPLGLWEAVHHLKARGILTAVCSKNEESIVRERWSRAIMDDWITLDDFTFVAIGWQPKAEAIAGIIAEASLTPRSVVFVDDNPVERAAVKAAMPDIRVLGANPYVVRRVLLWSAETQIARLTDESRERDAMMRRQREREQEKAALSREEFLAGLGCRVSVRTIESQDGESFARAYELLNKTNQFNTTGKRWTSAEVAAFFRSGGRFYVFEVEDKFTRYGLVGVILYRRGHFHQFAMSCRVIGLEIETSVIGAILGAEREKEFTAEVVETDANIVCRGVYEACGFVPDPRTRGSFRSRAPHAARVAHHLAISGLAAAPARTAWSFAFVRR